MYNSFTDKNLESIFWQICSKYSDNNEYIARMWNDLRKMYSQEHRFYHNFEHIIHFIEEVEFLKDQLNDYETFFLAALYHDCYYEVFDDKNEEKSAEICKKRLLKLNYPESKIQQCINLILATKKHKFSKDSDTNYFIDADLSILGNGYKDFYYYTFRIRKEYSYLPSELFTLGRLSFIENFLKKERIFNTNFFYNKYEISARKNLNREKKELQGNS